jgi:DNA-binding transcriptional regulator YiaG
MAHTDCNFELQNSRKAPLRRKEAGVDPESGLPIVFAPRLIRNPKTDEQAIVASVAEEARWARKWRVPVETVRMTLERAIPAEFVGHHRNYSSERLPVADKVRSAINDLVPSTASDFHALEAKGDVWLLRAELPDGSHLFSLTGIDSRVLEQSHTLAIRAGRDYLDSSDDPFTDWAKEVWHFHVRRLEASWIKDRRDRFTTSPHVYGGDEVRVRCPSESLDGFCAVSADFAGSLGSRHGRSPRSKHSARRGRPPAGAIEGSVVKNLRLELDLGQAVFAKRCRISEDTLQVAEKRSLATDQTIKKIERFAKRNAPKVQLKLSQKKKSKNPSK